MAWRRVYQHVSVSGTFKIREKKIFLFSNCLIVAVAGIDDAASVAIFGIIASIMFGTGSMAYQIAQAPVCVIGGLAFGKTYIISLGNGKW